MPRPKDSKTTKYTWFLTGEGIYCYNSPEGLQTLTKLWEAVELSAFHDAELADATKKINDVLSRIEKSNRGNGRKLSLVAFQNRHLLVWAKYGVIGPSDDDASIKKALRLKSR